MGRGLIIALAVSVALNVFIGGFVAGRALNPPPQGPIAGAQIAPGLNAGDAGPANIMRAAGVLPPQARRKFRAQIRAKIPEMRNHAREVHVARRTLGETLAAPTWNRSDVEAVIETMQAAQARQRALTNVAFVNAFEALSPQERVMLLQQVNRVREEQRRQSRPGGQ